MGWGGCGRPECRASSRSPTWGTVEVSRRRRRARRCAMERSWLLASRSPRATCSRCAAAPPRAHRPRRARLPCCSPALARAAGDAEVPRVQSDQRGRGARGVRRRRHGRPSSRGTPASPYPTTSHERAGGPLVYRAELADGGGDMGSDMPDSSLATSSPCPSAARFRTTASTAWTCAGCRRPVCRCRSSWADAVSGWRHHVFDRDFERSACRCCRTRAMGEASRHERARRRRRPDVTAPLPP